LRDPSSERTRFTHRSSPGYPVSAVDEKKESAVPEIAGPEGRR